MTSDINDNKIYRASIITVMVLITIVLMLLISALFLRIQNEYKQNIDKEKILMIKNTILKAYVSNLYQWHYMLDSCDNKEINKVIRHHKEQRLNKK